MSVPSWRTQLVQVKMFLLPGNQTAQTAKYAKLVNINTYELDKLSSRVSAYGISVMCKGLVSYSKRLYCLVVALMSNFLMVFFVVCFCLFYQNKR